MCVWKGRTAGLQAVQSRLPKLFVCAFSSREGSRAFITFSEGFVRSNGP